MADVLLAPVFREASAATLADDEVLESRLARLVAEARTAWPEVAVAPEAFVGHLGRHAARDADPLGFVDAVHAADLYLACAVCAHDKAALAAFERDYIARVGQYVVRVTVEHHVVDEVKQTLRERLVLGPDGSPKIAEYSGRGALGGWVRVAAVRTALNAARDRPQFREASEDEPAPSADPELSLLKARARDLFKEAFASVLGGLDPAGRTLLRLHYVEGMTMDQLSRLYQTPRSTIARRIDGVRQEILSSMEHLLRDERRLSPSEVASVLRVAGSQMQLTLTRLLR